jgi:MFS family permease
MALVSKRTVILLLAALVLLSIALRYPVVEHERNQTDSYFIHLLSQSIVDNGYAKWTFSPLSYLGYYPFSYPSGVPFVMAEVSSLTGLSVESSILCANFVFASLFALAVFGLTRIFIRKPEFIILACLFAVLGPRFVDTTFWCGSARGVIAVLVPLVLFASFRASVTGQRRLLVISLLLAIGCFFAHHMAVLLVVFALGYVMAVLLGSFLPKKVPHDKRGAVTASALLAILFIGLLALWHFQYFEFLGFYDLQKTRLFDLNPPGLSVAVNMAMSYTNQIGFILVLAFLGVPYVFRRSGVRTESLFLLTLPIAFVPLLGSSLYVSMLLSPFVAILGTLWLARLAKSSRFKFAALPVIAIMLVSSVALPIWSTERWNEKQYLSGETVEVSNQVFNDALYLRVGYQRASIIGNVNVMTTELAATSDSTFLGSWIFMALTGDIKYEDIKNNVTWSDARFPRNLYIWFAYPPDPNVSTNIIGLMLRGVDFVSSPQVNPQGHEYFSDHPKIVVAVDNLWPLHYIDTYSIRYSTFMDEIQHSEAVGHQEFSSYKSYESEGVTLYIVYLSV